MSEKCNSNCSSCGKDCNSRKEENKFLAKMNKHSNIKKVIGIVSGKGGVGKSMVTSLLAVELYKLGKKVAILDGDITGPSIPRAFGIREKVEVNEYDEMIPAQTKEGIKVLSMNMLVDEETSPVVWRGPVIGGAVKQFWTDGAWGDVDYMLVDMPPGTSDVPLTVFQSLPVSGIVIVSSPQELVNMIVEKAAKMAEKMNIPVYGIVENMSYFICPDCNKKHYIYGQSKVKEVADKYGIDACAYLPIDKELATLVDEGRIAQVQNAYLDEIIKRIK